MSLGFPHSTAGAVSAADALASEVGSTLDPDRAAAVMRMVADPSFAGGPQQAARGVASDRTALGLQASGPVPQGYGLELSAAGVPGPGRQRGPGDGAPAVPTSSPPRRDSGTTTKIGVFPVALHWAQGDWKVLPTPATDYSGLTAEPGSAQAASLGWQQLDS